MTSRRHITAQLEKLGLSKAQADIYLLLTVHRELRIQEIARRANMPRSSVYENLRALQEMGLTEQIVDDSHKKVRPYPISALRHRLEDRLADIRHLVDGIDTLEQDIAAILPAESQPSTVLRYYRGRTGARQLYWNTLRAKDVVYVYSDWARRDYIGDQFYRRFVAESRARAITEQVLTNPTHQAMASIRKHNLPQLSDLARTHITDIRFLDERAMVVRGDTLIYDTIYAQVYLNNNEINGFEIESANFVASQRSIFETLWSMARPLNDLL